MVSSQANHLSTLAKLWSKLHISEPLVTLQNPWKSSGFGLLQPGQNLIASNTFRNTAKEGRNKKTLHKQDILCKSANCEQKYRNMQINLDMCTLTHSEAQTPRHFSLFFQLKASILCLQQTSTSQFRANPQLINLTNFRKPRLFPAADLSTKRLKCQILPLFNRIYYLIENFWR